MVNVSGLYEHISVHAQGRGPLWGGICIIFPVARKLYFSGVQIYT